MKKVIISIFAASAFVLLAAYLVGSFVFGNYVYYYTRIDNTKYSNTHKNNEIYYTYTLPSYDPDGDMSELVFDTVRELRSNAFLKLKVSRVVGVLDWEEVKLNDIPEAIRGLFSQNE